MKKHFQRLKAWLAALGRRSAPMAIALAGMLDLRDLFCFGGLGLLAYGLHLVYPPAAYIAPGAILLWMGVR